MKVYIAGLMSNRSFEETAKYFLDTSKALKVMGYEVFHPMTGKGYLVGEAILSPEGYTQTLSTNHAIIERDRWMIGQSDVVYMDLTGAKRVSIGCMMELAWAYELRKYVVLIMEPDNIHRHSFVLEAADVLFETNISALEYLYKLSTGSL